MDATDWLTFDDARLKRLSATEGTAEWVDEVGAFLLLKVERGQPPLAATLDAALADFEQASEGRGRLVFVESLSVAGVRSVLYVVQMHFEAEALVSIGQTPSYSATLTVPFAEVCVHFNAAYNRQLAALAPAGGEGFATLDDPPTYLAGWLRRVADSTVWGAELQGAAPFFADG